MKIVGVIIIMSCSVMLGVSAVWELIERVGKTEALLGKITELKSLVCCLKLPIDEATQRCGIYLAGDRNGTKTFAERWNEWASGEAHNEALTELGSYLTSIDEESKSAAFDRAISDMQRSLDLARDKKAKDAKLFIALSVLGGAAVAIILI